jgi:hypothetical protein
MAEEMPAPPYPARDKELLRFIVDSALAALEAGEVDLKGAVVHAAVHGWLEGHLEGERCGAACIEDERWHPFGQAHPELN